MLSGKIINLRRVVVTGMGLVTPLGNSLSDSWKKLMAGCSGIARVTKFAADLQEFCQRYKIPEDFPLIAGEVKDFDFKARMLSAKPDLTKEDLKLAKYTDSFTQYALTASYEALAQSRLDPSVEDPERLGTIIATGMGGVASWEEACRKFDQEGVKRVSPFMVPKLLPNLAAGNVAISIGAQGPNTALSSACAAGGQAIGAAFRSIQLGEADIMLAGGAEAALTPLTVAGFYRMGALATGFNDRPEAASRPFDQGHAGFVLAEGAGIMVLEELTHALNRNAPIFAELSGFGMCGDGHHITDPDLKGAIRCMRRAMQDAGIEPREIDYLNPHATSTPVGDRNEARAISQLFPQQPAVSATKSLTGHLLGAAGAVEAIFTVLSVHQGVIPPSLNLVEIDPDCAGLSLVAGEAQNRTVRYALSNSFGFGGTNAALLFKRYPSWIL
ncbi:MAG TPA: beta-ketoacyl-[acyl-carrier-protein] synthase II [Desulfobacterales bacterium]|nr:beta-ketoacyl-[acyl-carrier-protein] synthase II [Desulfobacterales bacterium]